MGPLPGGLFAPLRAFPPHIPPQGGGGLYTVGYSCTGGLSEIYQKCLVIIYLLLILLLLLCSRVLCNSLVYQLVLIYV